MIAECSHCESKVDCEEVGCLETEITGWPSRFMLLVCSLCSRPLLGLSEITQVSEDKYDWDLASRLWPDPETTLDLEIPEIARNSLIEAKLCFRAQAYSACAVMCGRAIEGVCKNHDSKIKTLASGLKKLQSDGVIDNRLYEWGEALREGRNLGAHASIEKVSKDDAKDLLDFSTAICEYVFVLNKKWERFRSRKSQKVRESQQDGASRAVTK